MINRISVGSFRNRKGDLVLSDEVMPRVFPCRGSRCISDEDPMLTLFKACGLCVSRIARELTGWQTIRKRERVCRRETPSLNEKIREGYLDLGILHMIQKTDIFAAAIKTPSFKRRKRDVNSCTLSIFCYYINVQSLR